MGRVEGLGRRAAAGPPRVRRWAREPSAGEVPAGRWRAEPADLSAAVELAQRGDDRAFRTVYREVQPGLLRYLRALVGGDAEDVASEAWLQAVRDLDSFRGDSDGFRGWIATIARHRAMDHLRRQRRRPVASAPVETLADVAGPEDTAAGAIAGVGTDVALAMIAALPQDQAEAVLLRVVMGLDASTAGRVLGKRAGAVRTAAYRGLRRLAEQLQRDMESSTEQAGSRADSRGRVTETNAPTLRDMR